MKNDEEILQMLREATDGLLFMSESDYPFELVSWGPMDEVTSDYLCREAGAAPGAPVQVMSLEQFFERAMSEPEWKGKQELVIARRYQALVRLLKENLDELRVYKIGEINIPVYILGRSNSGNWLGLSTRVVET
jgi:hypothetical protein